MRTVAGFEVAANASIVTPGASLAERLHFVRASGIESVELWWPFSSPSPSVREVDRFLSLLDGSGLRLVAMNLYQGNSSFGDRGVMFSDEEFPLVRSSAAVAVRVANETGCRMFNTLFGPGDLEDVASLERAVECYSEIAGLLACVGGIPLLEPLTVEDARWVISSLADAERVANAVEELAGHTCGLLLDAYHLINNGIDPAAEARSRRIRHVQVADAPGRGAPGSGRIDFVSLFSALHGAAYDGRVACEFRGAHHPSDLVSWCDRLDAACDPTKE